MSACSAAACLAQPRYQGALDLPVVGSILVGCHESHVGLRTDPVSFRELDC